MNIKPYTQRKKLLLISIHQLFPSQHKQIRPGEVCSQNYPWPFAASNSPNAQSALCTKWTKCTKCKNKVHFVHQSPWNITALRSGTKHDSSRVSAIYTYVFSVTTVATSPVALR